MPTQQEVKRYCDAFGLHYVEAPTVPLDDVDEYPDVVCAGFQGDPWYGACMVTLNVHGVCRIVTRFADGMRHMEDRRETVHAVELQRAITMGLPIHPTDD